MNAVRARGVGRIYPKTRRNPEVVALDGVDLDLAEGEVHGLLGPNGAGKTTLVKIISTVLLPTSGTVEVLGHDVMADPRAVRRLVGVVFGGERGLYTRVSARRNVLFWGAMYGLRGRELRQRADALLDRVGLAERADVPAGALSHGEKRALELAIALAMEPKLLLLDEPMAGTGREETARLVGLLRGLKGRYPMVLVEHDMTAVFRLADRISVLVYGRCVATGRPEDVRADPAVKAAYLGEEATFA